MSVGSAVIIMSSSTPFSYYNLKIQIFFGVVGKNCPSSLISYDLLFLFVTVSSSCPVSLLKAEV